MAQKLLAALALAQLSQAFLDDYVEVVKKVDIIIPPVGIAAEVVGAQQQQNNPGLTACAVADVVVSSCYDRGLLATTAPVASVRDCLCCFSATALYPVYSSCASYIYNSVTTASSVFSGTSTIISHIITMVKLTHSSHERSLGRMFICRARHLHRWQRRRRRRRWWWRRRRHSHDHSHRRRSTFNDFPLNHHHGASGVHLTCRCGKVLLGKAGTGTRNHS